jgi:hypothetical protein
MSAQPLCLILEAYQAWRNEANPPQEAAKKLLQLFLVAWCRVQVAKMPRNREKPFDANV